MKKIRILTFHYAHNYGAMLQAYALQKVLFKGSNDVKFVDYRKRSIENSYKIFKPIRKNIIKWVRDNINSLKYYNLNKKRYKAFNKFMYDKLNLTERINNIKQLENHLEADIYITGSDQVWNINIVKGLSDMYTLNFKLNNIKKIAYAASVGDAGLIVQNADEYKNKISQIDYISVRENDAKIELGEIINKDIEVVLDPTLLLTKIDWNNEIEGCSCEKHKYIVAYVVNPDSEYVKIVNYLSEKTGLKIIHFDLKNPGYNNVLKSAYTEGPLNFVNYIKNAEYVVATSFHATVFSIIFNKKFFIIPHRKTGARVINLLRKLDIDGRNFTSLDEFKNINYNFETDWESVEKKLAREREKSINWLNNAIEGVDEKFE